MNSKNIFLILIIIFASFFSYAQKSSAIKGLNYKIEPLFGFETVYRSTPTPHTATHAMYGVRLTAGIDLISAEAEYTKGSDTENYIVAPETVKTNDEKLKLGVRSTYKLGTEFLTITARLGGETKKSSVESISGGVSTSNNIPVQYSPYAGALLGVHLGRFMTLNLGTTVVFKDLSDMSKNDYQNTLSFGIGI